MGMGRTYMSCGVLKRKRDERREREGHADGYIEW